MERTIEASGIRMSQAVWWIGNVLEVRGIGVRIPVGAACSDRLGPHPTSHQMGGGDFLLQVKQPWPETVFSLPCSTVEVKNVWNSVFTPYVFVAPCLVKHRNNLTLSFWWLTICCLPHIFLHGQSVLGAGVRQWGNFTWVFQKSCGHWGCIAVDEFDLWSGRKNGS